MAIGLMIRSSIVQWRRLVKERAVTYVEIGVNRGDKRGAVLRGRGSKWLIMCVAVVCLVQCSGAGGGEGGAVKDMVRERDYPTGARAEYVFACMAANEMTQAFLYRCSCAIDTIARRMSYADYEKAETMVRIQLGHSPREQAYRSVGVSKTMLDNFFRAQAASELECF